MDGRTIIQRVITRVISNWPRALKLFVWLLSEYCSPLSPITITNNTDHINNKNTKYNVYLEALNVSQHCIPFLEKVPIRPIYSCVLSCLAFEWKWGWTWSCFDQNLPAFITKSSEVSIKARSRLASHSLKAQATKHTTVKWSITLTN